MATILVTCAGTGVGQSAIDSLCLIRKDRIIACDMNRDIYARHYCDMFYTVPSLYSEEYLDCILDICHKERVNLIIPGHDHELLLLSENISIFNKRGIEVIVSLPDLIEISRDKYEWYNFFRKHDCPVVPTYRVSDFKKNPDISIFPAIVKPTSGSASQGIFIVQNTNDLSLVSDNDILQPYLFPLKDDSNYQMIFNAVKKRRFIQVSEISIQLIFTKKSVFSGLFISKNVLKNGVPILIEPIKSEDFEYTDDIMKFVSVCTKMNVKGPVNIQGRITDRGLLCFEMNMRFTGITGNRAQLGFNEVSFLVDNFLDRDSSLCGYTSNKLGVRQVACTTVFKNNTNQNNKTLTILGGGSIGTAFLKSINRNKNVERINLIVRDSSFSKYKSLYNSDKIHVISGSDNSLEMLFAQSDILLNFIGALAFKPEHEIYESLRYQHSIVSKIIKSKVPLIINISSQSVYNHSQDIIKDEASDTHAKGLYAFQKIMSEEFFQSINTHAPSMKVISLRLGRVLNTNAPEGFFANIIDHLMRGKSVHINPYNKINLIDMEDVVDSIGFIIENNQKLDFPSIINIGGQNISIIDYCKSVIRVLNIKEGDSLLSINEGSSINETSMINTELIQSFGWEFKYDVERIIKKIAQKILK